MPIRIYALAKELEIDSKELVEVCTKSGHPRQRICAGQSRRR